MADRAEFVVIANRLPVDRYIAPDGEVTWRTSPGGLVAALEPVMRRKGGAWIGWGGAADEKLKGTTFYALTRALQLRFMRIPKSRVKLGQQLPDTYR